ncbi:MAG: radical SAM protein [Prevotella sp.]|nr:radical SAM protein [Prevotella sp.]
MEYKEYLLPSELTERAPNRVDFFITKHCNLSSKHCFEGSAPSLEIKQFSQKEIIYFIQQLKSANIQTLKITGGEPFSHPNIKQILKEVESAHFETIVLTNATLIDDEAINLIKTSKVQLGISLDGITSQTHDYVRGNGAFEKTIAVLRKLSHNSIRFAITCSITNNNRNQINDIANFVLQELKAEVLYLNRIRPMGRAKKSSIVISDKDYQIIINTIYELKKIYGNKIILSDDAVAMCTNSSDIIHCAAGNTLLAIDDSFNVYPCIYGIGNKDYVVGNLLENRLDEIWALPCWDIFRGKIKINDLTDCRLCTKNRTCAMKNCRLKPVYEGRSFFSSISYCEKTYVNSNHTIDL